eukprot:g1421.t1
MSRVAVGQLRSTADPVSNFEKIRHLVQRAKHENCQLLALPECFSFLGTEFSESLAIAEDLDGPTIKQYMDLAKEYGIWLSLGGFQEVGPDPNHIYNTHVVLSSEGTIVSKYQKIHLFSYSDPEHNINLKEDKFTTPGAKTVCCDSPVGRLGLSICYDLRFPALYQTLRFRHGAEILLVPAAFTVKTGKAHWEVLLRSRAIETQSYIVAAAQTSKHNSKRESYGHSLIIDPWGEILVDLETQEDTLGIAEIDIENLRKLRQSMPLDQHRCTPWV